MGGAFAKHLQKPSPVSPLHSSFLARFGNAPGHVMKQAVEDCLLLSHASSPHRYLALISQENAFSKFPSPWVKGHQGKQSFGTTDGELLSLIGHFIGSGPS